MRGIFGTSRREDSEWVSVSDLMAGLMVIFLFIAIVFIRDVTKEEMEVRNVAVTWQANESQILERLKKEFSEDLERWNAEILDRELLFRFKSPEVLFEHGKDVIRPRFVAILEDFFPRYIKILEPFHKGGASIEEIRIEGHTSSDWSGVTPEEAYFHNMELSQARTRAVLQHVLELPEVAESRSWVQPLLTANGLSSSDPIYYSGTQKENPTRSRRVDFRVLTTAKKEIFRILKK